MTLRKINLMHKCFGENKTRTCAECSHFHSGRYHNRTLFKCDVYGMTHSEASDWRKSYTACGMFNKPYEGNNIIRLVRPEKEKSCEEPLQGQESLFKEAE